jgi:nicotinamidase-related amidase
MSSFIVAVVMSLAFGTYAGSATAQSAEPAPSGTEGPKPMITLQMPPIPEPVAVTLKPASTAVLVFDVVEPICTSQPKCLKTMVPAISALLARARKAGVIVGYGTRAPNMSKWRPEVAPEKDDVTFVSYGQDRFFNTDLDKTLKAKGVTTLILTGWKISGSVLYTSVGATLHGYTVVIPVDASQGPTDYEEIIGLYQILNQNAANPTNQPLKEKTSTLTRTNLITFQ